jgi:hypothetical protein
MRKLVLIAFACMATAACTPTTTGTTAGATTGSVDGGPLGALFGGVGATTGAVTGAVPNEAGPGRCYVRDSAGNIVVNRAGSPVTNRC